MRVSVPVLVLSAFVMAAGCERQRDAAPAATASVPAITTLQKKDVQVGDGAEAQPGTTAVVHYTGWLYEPGAPQNRGRKFDSSRDRGEPFRFRVGAGQVIRGWDEGVVGMRVNGQRELVIPSELGYGPMGAGETIPPNATLLFEVELLALE